MALAVARASAAQVRGCAAVRLDTATPPAVTRWTPPLDRSITAHAMDLSLRDALDRVAAAARLRMSYSAELLPLNRAVCLAADGVAVGQVLADLLTGTNIVAIGVGGDQVVLAPRREAAPARVTAPAMANSLGVLDRVVVTGSATAGTTMEREISVGLNVIDGRQLTRDNTSTVSGALDAYVPGVWGWAQSPSSMVSSYASIRGASSFGLSYPKMYIDGIEVANPLLLARFIPGSIERIEVIRGPQGSALYGTDAISGVVNIVTRHEGAPADGSRASLRSTAGVSQNGPHSGVLASDVALSIATGTSARSADLHVAAGSMGAFVPDGSSHDFMATASARAVGTISTVSGTARLFVEHAGSPSNPLLPLPRTLPGDSTRSGNGDQSVTEYTIGATATTAVDDQWTVSLVGGIDGYRLANVQSNFTPIPSQLDSALHAAAGGADRATMRASSVYRVNGEQPTRATFTLSAEHATLRVSSVGNTAVTGGPSPVRGRSNAYEPAEPAKPRVVSWQNSTGIVAQTNVALNDFVFATGGVRFEHDSRLAGVDQIETLPMLGAAAVSEHGPLTVKLRTAWGRGIRPPSTASQLQFWQTQNGQVSQAPLGPERQSGVETGIDVLLKHALTLQVTRFDQRASGLIQPVGIPADSGEKSRRMIYVLQQVGEITNRGWELQGTSAISQLTITGTLSFVNSRVERLATGYSGDLVTGDRMLQIPARTESINFAWTANRWHASLGGARALDWINYDKLKLTQAFASNMHSAHDMTGAKLRQYWAKYDGGLRVRASFSRDIRDALGLELSGDNLLNYQTGEPDNITIIPGRTIMTGVRLKF